MAQKSPSRTQDKFMTRMPEGMREKIKQAADKSGRSMNAEIVHRLEQSFYIDINRIEESQFMEDHRKHMDFVEAQLKKLASYEP